MKLESQDLNLFWNYRYELLKNNTPFALTKIMNSVKWGDPKCENEFLKNILYRWKKIELCDILYMLSKKFSVNKLYVDNFIINLNGMKILRKFAIKKLNSYFNSDINFILIQLVQAIKYEDISINNYCSPLVHFLIERCCQDINLASSFYWLIECETSDEKNDNKEITKIYTSIKNRFLKDIEIFPNISKVIQNEINFKNELLEVNKKLTECSTNEEKQKKLTYFIKEDKKKFFQNEEHYLPINPQIKIKGTDFEKCKVFTSSKCPVKYTFKITNDTKNYTNFDKDYINLMFKVGDDLRQDQLILQMISYMDSLLKKSHLNYEFTVYKTLATNQSIGFIEYVPNSKTFSEIISKNNNQLKQYFTKISKSDDDYNKKLDSFINSCAGYAVVTYILGVGDRNLDNLMIKNDGKIFHIDFGYILGKEPPLKFSSPPVRLCQEMVELMGGKGSVKYDDFKQKCINAYLVLRDNARVIVNMFYLMIDSGIPELNDVEILDKLYERFEPRSDKKEASEYFVKILEESVNAFVMVFMDKVHAWGQYMKQ